MVWATAAALTLMLLMTATLLLVIMINGLGVFWPAPLEEVTLADGGKLLGRRITSQTNPDNNVLSIQFKTANREFDPRRQDFRWIPDETVRRVEYPAAAMVLERAENGDFYGFLEELKTPTLEVPAHGTLRDRFDAAVAAVAWQRRDVLEPIAAELSTIERPAPATHRRDEETRLPEESRAGRRPPRRTRPPPGGPAASAANPKRPAHPAIATARGPAAAGGAVAAPQRGRAGRRARPAALVVLSDIVRSYQPNAMGLAAKTGHYLAKIWELLTDKPRESNTEGGLAPAIFGTVMLVFLMAASCFPLGVLAGVYLGEYARDGVLVRLVRIAVNNLAGIPSIVYGIFGLGFFVYGVGALLDQWLLSGAGGGRQPHLRHRRHPLGQPDARPADRAGGDRRPPRRPSGRSRGASARVPTPWGRPSSRRCCACCCRWRRRAS